MPSARKQRVLDKTLKRRKKGIVYLVGIVLIVIAVSVGWYAYSVATAPKPDFTISAPSGVTIHAGPFTTSTTINVTAVNNFAGTVLLTATGSPGLTASITPSSLTGSGTATLKTSAVANGTYTVTVTGTSGSLIHSVVPKVATPVFATLVTSKGTIVVELYRAQAPKTVANIVSLAESGFYNNLTWHRVSKTNPAVIQTGDPTSRNAGGDNNTWGQHGSSQTVPLEIDSSLHNFAGYLGMARSSDPNSGSSQFYINTGDNTALDGGYTVFGKVISGMDIVTAIGSVPVYPGPNSQPITPVFLTSLTISNS